MNRILAGTIFFVLLGIPAAHAVRRGDGNVWPKTWVYSHASITFDPARMDSLTWYDGITAHDMDPPTVRWFRNRHRSMKLLAKFEPQRPEWWDGDPDVWWMAAGDTTWSLIRRLQFYTWANRDAGGSSNGWIMRDTSGRRMYEDVDRNGVADDGDRWVANWTEHCPVGVYGTSRGLRMSEWVARVLIPDITQDPESPWSWDCTSDYGMNGVVFETLIRCWGPGGANWPEADPDADGVAEGVTLLCWEGGDQEPLSLLETAECSVFWRALKEAMPTDFVFVANDYPDCMHLEEQLEMNGVKLENWMTGSYPFAENWRRWFYGWGGVGYLFAERNYGIGAPYRGWATSMVRGVCCMDGICSISYPPNVQRFRLTLGTAMLGDGYCIFQKPGENEPLWPPELDWDFGTPIGDFERDPAGSDTVYVRLFTRGMVEVNPHSGEVHGVPGRDARFTFWEPVQDLRCEVLGNDAIRARWTFPGDEHNAADLYELRYARHRLTIENWETGSSYAGNPIDASPGDSVAVVMDHLDPNTAYTFALRARTRGRWEPVLSNIAEAMTTAVLDTIDETPLVAPTGLRLRGPDAEGRIRIEWDASPAPEVVGYNVYAGLAGAWERANEDPIPASVTSFSFLSDRTAFCMTTLDRLGRESPQSEIVNLPPGAAGLFFAGPFPNPARGSCRFEMRIPPDLEAARVSVRVHDVSGRGIRTLYDAVPGTAGPIAIEWDGRDEAGAAAAAGLYVVRLDAHGRTTTRRTIRLAPGSSMR